MDPAETRCNVRIPAGRDAVVVEVGIEQAQVQLFGGVGPLQAPHDTLFRRARITVLS